MRPGRPRCRNRKMRRPTPRANEQIEKLEDKYGGKDQESWIDAFSR